MIQSKIHIYRAYLLTMNRLGDETMKDTGVSTTLVELALEETMSGSLLHPFEIIGVQGLHFWSRMTMLSI
jgi:hypothetical protein